MKNRVLRLLIRILFLCAGMACLFMCGKMLEGRPVRMPGLWTGGLILLLAWAVFRLSRMHLCERYTMKRFEDLWIEDRKTKKGLMYRDKPGCYVILIYRFPPVLPGSVGYSNVYVGQSLEVYHRVHSHLNRKGNGDVYADVRDGRHIEIEVYSCRKDKLNEMEISLIRKYDAEEYYNRTAGGAAKRKRF